MFKLASLVKISSFYEPDTKFSFSRYLFPSVALKQEGNAFSPKKTSDFCRLYYSSWYTAQNVDIFFLSLYFQFPYRSLGVRWCLAIEEKSMGRVHCFNTDEDFIFSHHNLTARWNDLYGAPSLSKVKSISMYASTPLLYDSSWSVVENR